MQASLPRLLVGASGFSYSSWRGGFYPEGTPPEEFLARYAERLPTVELNATFYRLTGAAQFERWAAETPPGFEFAVTMSRAVTARGSVQRLDEFLAGLRGLGGKLGPVRVKVPQARDDGFLALLFGSVGPELRLALDFRHDSWDDPEVQARLDEQGAARVGSLGGAAPFRYLRFRDPPYDEAALTALAAEIRPLVASGVAVYGYFRHEDEATAPAYAARLLELAAAE